MTIKIQCRFSYVHVFTPDAFGNNDPKYSADLIIPKSDTKTIDMINKAVDEVLKANPELKGNIRKPLKDGDIERPDKPPYKNAYYMKASSKFQPGIYDPTGNPAMGEDEFYSGCYGVAEVTLKGYSVTGNKGVSAYLNNVIKLKDGEPLGGGAKDGSEIFADYIDVLG